MHEIRTSGMLNASIKCLLHACMYFSETCIDLSCKFPVHHINHWCLVSVNVENCQVSLYDSLSHLNKCNSFMDAIEFKESEERVGARKWRKEICPSVPQQDNMNDCGVYVCMNARNIVEQSAFRFTHIS